MTNPVAFGGLLLAGLVLTAPFDGSAQSSLPQAQARTADVGQSGRGTDGMLPYPNPMLSKPAAASVNPPASGWDPGRDLLGRISEIYKLQVATLEAQMAGDELSAEDHLIRAIGELQALLAEEPEVRTERRFAELYRSVMAEYKEFYGVEVSGARADGEVFSVLEELFREDDLLTAVEMDLPDGLQLGRTEVPLVQNSHVNRHLMYYTIRRPEVMQRWLERSTTYFPMMERIFKEENAPTELIHLSMIESGLVPTARSWASAVGLWQFIRATGAMYGLEVNWWVDERRDPEKATRAAARHLRDLYEIWGDWHLAMANYNISPRGLRRAINAAGGVEDYWTAYPYLPRETRGYVPGYIAATMIATNPEAFGFSPPRGGVPYEYDVAEVDGLMPLEALAAAAGVGAEELRALNPELLRWATPPGSGYPLKIPKGSRNAFLAAYEQIPKDERVSELAVHTVARGESLGLIASKYGTTIRSLYENNEGLTSLIRPGQRIFVPAAPGSMEKMAASVPTNQPTARSSTRASQTRTVQPPSNTTGVVYSVKSNDTIGHIAEWYDVRAWQLRTWNGIGNTIRVGQRLTVYVPSQHAGFYSKINDLSFDQKQRIESRQANGESLADLADVAATADGAY